MSLFNDLVSLLQPHMTDDSARRALVERALYGYSALDHIEWRGAAANFTPRLVRTLLVFGDCAPAQPAIVRLLTAPPELPPASEDSRGRIFISRASAHCPAVAPLDQRLKADRPPVWIDNLLRRAPAGLRHQRRDALPDDQPRPVAGDRHLQPPA